MSSDKINWEPDIREAFEKVKKWPEVKSVAEQGSVPTKFSYLKILDWAGGFADNLNNGKSSS